MRRVLLLVLLLVLSITAKTQLFTAVNEFDSRNLSEHDVAAISDKIRDEMQKREMFKIMARKEMGAILVEQEFQQTGVCDESCVAEIGKVLGVNYIVSGSIGKVESVYYITLKFINVSTSEIEYSVSGEFKGRLEDLLTTHAKKVVDDLEKEVQADYMGKMSIAAKTSDADSLSAFLSVNGKDLGVVPFTTDFLYPGTYELKLTKPTFESVIKQIDLKAGDNLKLNYTMSLSKAYTDSLAAIAKKEKKKKQWVRRAIFGSVAAGFLGSGLYFDKKCVDADERVVAAKTAYTNAPVGSDFMTLRNNINTAEDTYKGYKTKRGLSYGAAGTFTLALVISIPF